MGHLSDIVQTHMDAQPYRVSERQVAQALGVTQTTLKNWRAPKRLICQGAPLAISRVTHVPYSRVLDALLTDIDYLRQDGDGNAEDFAEHD